MEKRFLFPTTEFGRKYFEMCNSSEEFAKSGKGWGVDFNGDWCYVFENIPLEKVDMEKLPENVKKEAEEFIINNTIYAYYETKDGKYLSWRPLKDPKDAEKAGFIYSGDYGFWKEILTGKTDPIKAVMSGKMKLKGDMSKVLKKMKFILAMQKCVAEIAKVTDFIDEVYPKK